MPVRDSRYVSREVFAKDAEPILEKGRKKTRRRTVDLYEVFCGVLYVLDTGCPWRRLPPEFPKWQACYQYFQRWDMKDAHGQTPLKEALKKCGWHAPTKPWVWGWASTGRPAKRPFFQNIS